MKEQHSAITPPDQFPVELGQQPSDDRYQPADTAPVQETLKVSVALLDSLMTLAGELVLSRNQLLQTISVNGLKCAESVGQRIDLITSELQEAIMLTRMQPIGVVFDTLPGLVADIAAASGTQIELLLYGRDVELDKTIIETIGAPLASLLTVAARHGIETPQRRKELGKPLSGSIVLRAFHEAGQVIIEIEDDGDGMDGDRIVAAAVSCGMLTAEQAQAMTPKERLNLIFADGLQNDNLPARGSGLSSARSAVEALGGQIDMEAEPGRSTVVSIKLPLTLAIIPCQVVVVEDERYAIPQVNLEELLRIPASQVKQRIEVVGSAEVVRLRGRLLPLVRLADVLGIERTFFDSHEGRARQDRRQRIADRRSRKSALHDNGEASVDEKSFAPRTDHPDRRQSPDSALNIVVVTSGAMNYGLIVDHLQDSEEIVIKPLGRHLQQCDAYAGATIMGDGRIALILDVANIASLAQLRSVDDSTRATQLREETGHGSPAAGENRSVLVFHSNEQEQFAVSLSRVDRIEKIVRSDIEILGDKRVMQYRGGSLNLACMDDIAQVQPLADRNDLLVIVFSFGTHSVGLLACGPIDTCEIDERADTATLRQPGIAGSTIITGQTTLLVDIDEMIGQLYPHWTL